MTAIAIGLALLGLAASSTWAVWEWGNPEWSTGYPDRTETLPARLLALGLLQVLPFSGLVVALVDWIRQRRDETPIATVTIATAILDLVVSAVVFGQVVLVWLYEPYDLVVIGRPLPGTALPTDPRGWAWDARMEHQAVAAFLELADHLGQHGAPADLVAACQSAADEEAGHATDSAALAGIALGPLPESRRALPSRRRMAWESFRHGVLGEGRAVAVARNRLRGPLTPPERALLERIAREERSHAHLSARVVAWALCGR
ncbi:MAG: ferritin-like domain-containing protein [Alphaproteobacteria bacterium]|nr:ferritin-like domain-containing protein [Alphaproteobacteria bacterium]